MKKDHYAGHAGGRGSQDQDFRTGKCSGRSGSLQKSRRQSVPARPLRQRQPQPRLRRKSRQPSAAAKTQGSHRCCQEGGGPEEADRSDHHGRLRPPRGDQGQRHRGWLKSRMLDKIFAENPLTLYRCIRSGRWSAGRPDGQLRGWPHQHRCRPHRIPGADPHHQGHPGRRFLRESRL